MGYNVWQRSACSCLKKKYVILSGSRRVCEWSKVVVVHTWIYGHHHGRANFNTDVTSDFVRDRNASSYIPETTTPPPRTTIELTGSTGGRPPLGSSWNCDTSTSHNVRDTEHERRTGTGGCGGDQETHFRRIAASTARSLTGRPYYLGQSSSVRTHTTTATYNRRSLAPVILAARSTPAAHNQASPNSVRRLTPKRPNSVQRRRMKCPFDGSPTAPLTSETTPALGAFRAAASCAHSWKPPRSRGRFGPRRSPPPPSPGLCPR